SKSHLRIEAYGTVDELNSHVGYCRDLLADPINAGVLADIQNHLFVIGSSLALDPEKSAKINVPHLSEQDVHALEKEIDRMEASLPPMKHFILPGGHPTVSSIHIARCVCRRAERCCVRLFQQQSVVEQVILQYMNRLSDYFFVFARYMAKELNVAETEWRPRT
ncbi:MAG TPA: cob(I)yrinic acid a,c-diamide adenosyltransferase, partial [Chitinophagaceae bacterium]